MIGWWIVISTQGPEERDRADQESRRAAILAQWETGADGIRWIEHLTETDKATKLAGGGYPNRYTARAGDVLPLIEGGGMKPPKDGVWIFGIDEGEEYAQPPQNTHRQAHELPQRVRGQEALASALAYPRAYGAGQRQAATADRIASHKGRTPQERASLKKRLLRKWMSK